MALDIGDWLSKGSPSDVQTGLFVDEDGKQSSVPLKHREVSARLFCDAGFCDTTERLHYVSDTDVTAVFKFPLPPRAAVYRFEAKIGDRTIKTQVKKKSEAQVDYDSATSQGHTAVLMKQESGDVYSVSLGNLEAMTECVVELRYVRLLGKVGCALEYVHSATWVPPYCGGRDLQQADKMASSTPAFAASVSYSLTYDLTLTASGAITAVESADGRGSISSSSPGCWQLRLSEQQSDPSKDLHLMVEMEQRGTAVLLQEVVRGGRTKTVALATFVPQLDVATAAAAATPREVWMVVDGSGSMGGSAERQARDAALLFVKDLPAAAGIKFNIVVFGSSYRFMHSSCVDYSAKSEAAAVQWINANVNASWGGTEILACMAAIYEQPITPGYRREIVFLTDGGITGCEEAEVYALIEQGTVGADSDTRDGKFLSKVKSAFKGLRGSQRDAPSATAAATSIYCLGIGHGVHRGLLDAMASKSGGVAQYVVHDSEIAKKCAVLKKAATSAATLRRAKLVAKGCVVKPAPAALPQVLFPGEPVALLAEVTHSDGGSGAALQLQAVAAGGEVVACEACLGGAEVVAGEALAVLHGMAYIGGLLAGSSHLHVAPDGSQLQQQPQEEVVKEEVVRAALEEGLVSPFTAAVGVLLRPDPMDSAQVEQVEVPLQVPAGRSLWQQRESRGYSSYGPSFARSAAFAQCAKPSRRLLFSSMVSSIVMPKAQPPAVFACAAPMPAPPVMACYAPAAPSAAPWADSSEDIAESTYSSRDSAAASAFDAKEAVRRLNLLRSSDGCWELGDEVLQLLTSCLPSDQREGAAEKLKSSCPAGLSLQQWGTVLVLAFLLQRCDSERAVWEGMEVKALAWLGQGWPQGVGSTGRAVLEAGRLV